MSDLSHCGLAVLASLVTPVLMAADVPHLLVPRSQEAPVVDGSLQDACWKTAALVDGLGPARGNGDEATIQHTTVRLVWTQEALHVAFSCRDDDVYADAAMLNDDNLYKADVCEVFIDGKGDQRQWIEIQVSPLNRVLDLVSAITADPQYTEALRLTQEQVDRDFWSDRTWSAPGLATASGRLVENGVPVGWTVEMSIPAAAFLRRPGAATLTPMDIRANLLRYDHPSGVGGRKFVQSNWAPVAQGCPHISPAAMGVVRLVESSGGEFIINRPGNGGSHVQKP